jgi:predicted lysophospholipase L1 biosynthesis ABC-type transport system permease subunit
MKSKEVYGAIGVAAIAAFVSWVFSCEVLFIMGTIIVLALSAVVGLVLGAITLAERLLPVKVESTERWPARTRTSVTQ